MIIYVVFSSMKTIRILHENNILRKIKATHCVNPISRICFSLKILASSWNDFFVTCITWSQCRFLISWYKKTSSHFNLLISSDTWHTLLANSWSKLTTIRFFPIYEWNSRLLIKTSKGQHQLHFNVFIAKTEQIQSKFRYFIAKFEHLLP